MSAKIALKEKRLEKKKNGRVALNSEKRDDSVLVCSFFVHKMWHHLLHYSHAFCFCVSSSAVFTFREIRDKGLCDISPSLVFLFYTSAGLCLQRICLECTQSNLYLRLWRAFVSPSFVRSTTSLKDAAGCSVEINHLFQISLSAVRDCVRPPWAVLFRLLFKVHWCAPES